MASGLVFFSMISKYFMASSMNSLMSSFFVASKYFFAFLRFTSTPYPLKYTRPAITLPWELPLCASFSYRRAARVMLRG